MRRYISTFLVVLLGLGVSQTMGQSSKLEDHPGYVDFGSVEDKLGVEANIQVSVKGALLKLVSAAASVEDREFANLIDGLKAIQVTDSPRTIMVRTYLKKQERLQNPSRKSSKKIGIRFARVRDRDEHVYVYIRDIDDLIQGMTVMVIDDDEGEAVFVNIVGKIDPAQIGRIGRKFRVNVLEDL